MLERILNHLLAQEPWARERLRGFACQHLRVIGGPLRLDLSIRTDGLFAQGEKSEEPLVTITLPPDAPLRLVLDRSSLLASAQLSGNADFAETLAFVFRNLNWDAEADVAKLTGDILARRLVQGGKAIWQWQSEAQGRLLGNVTEYLAEESGALVSASELLAFGSAVDVLRDDVARLEKRLARLP